MTGKGTFTILAAAILSAGAGPGAEEVPSSARSVKAIAGVRPRLESELDAKGLTFGAPIFIRIFKKERRLELWVQAGEKYKLFRAYPVCTVSGILGPKTRSGDTQGVEGFYHVVPGRMNPWSSYHLSFNLGYPNQYDRHHGRTGDLQMIHGNCVSIGCYAMTDPLIEEIYAMADAALRGGQPYFRVHVFPFRMNRWNLLLQRRTQWKEFWENLKEGFDYFEERRVPPNVTVRDGLYRFE